MKLEKIIKISGKIVLKTGLHIGAGNDTIHIGGIDNTVVRDPVTKEPYIPGSSLKGKIRTLLEWATGRVKDGNPWSSDNQDDPIVRIFGNGSQAKEKFGPTRVSISDCFLDKSEKMYEKLKEMGFTENKTEVAIDRIKGTASNSGPRTTERVTKGAKFVFEITYKVFDKTDESNIDLLLLGMKLLERDAIGGSTSRGYGRIKFEDVDVDGDKERFNNITLENDSFKNWEYTNQEPNSANP